MTQKIVGYPFWAGCLNVMAYWLYGLPGNIYWMISMRDYLWLGNQPGRHFSAPIYSLGKMYVGSFDIHHLGCVVVENRTRLIVFIPIRNLKPELGTKWLDRILQDPLPGRP